jgi:hypothetical protein
MISGHLFRISIVPSLSASAEGFLPLVLSRLMNSARAWDFRRMAICNRSDYRLMLGWICG